MRKFMVCIAVSMLYSMCAVAQNVRDVNNVRISPDEDARQKFYLVLSNGEEVQVSQLLYKIVEAEPSAFCAVSTPKGDMVFEKAALNAPDVSVYEVAGEPELVRTTVPEGQGKMTEKDMVRVTMTNGWSFMDESIVWLGVLPGQHVQVTTYYGVTHSLTVIDTVNRGTPITNNIAASAPAQSRIPQLLEEAEAKVNKAKEERLMANSAKKEKRASGPVTIVFGRK